MTRKNIANISGRENSQSRPEKVHTIQKRRDNSSAKLDAAEIEKAPDRDSDRRLTDSHYLYSNSDISKQLDGRRLKLPESFSGFKSKPTPNFDLAFADLRDADGPNDTCAFTDDDEEDLPSGRELLCANSARRSESKQDVTDLTSSDCDFEILVRDISI